MKLLFCLIFLFPAFTLGQESLYDGAQTLTEEEEHEAENYIHQGLAQTTYQEMCEGNEEACHSEQAWTEGAMSTVEGMMPMVSQMYGMFSGLAGGKFTANITNDHGEVLTGRNGDYTPNGIDAEGNPIYRDAEGRQLTSDSEEIQEAKNKTEEKMDYCGIIPMVSEPAAAAFQQVQNSKTQENYERTAPEAQQKAAFESLAQMHDDRAKAAMYQYAGWGATAGCYAAATALTPVTMDLKTGLKAGAATFLAGFYVAKEKAHKDRAEALRQMAQELPGAGDCNPHTETTCFCANKTSYSSDPTNYMKYCVADVLRRENNKPGVPCVTKDGKSDPECKCKQKNACLNARIAGEAMGIGLNAAQMQDPMAGIQHFSTGFDSGNLGAITQRNLARAKRELGKMSAREKVNIGGNEKAKKLAKSLMEAGIPKPLAASMAARGVSSQGALPPSVSNSTASLKPRASGKRNSVPSAGNRGKGRMKTGGTLGSKSKSSYQGKSPFGSRRQKASRTTGAEIMDFAEKAAREAEISKDKSKPIFEIITYRYKMRAWKEFEESMQDHMAKEKDL